MTKEQNYFTKLLNGDISLSITFWIWFLSIFIILKFTLLNSIDTLTYDIICFAYSLFIFVSIYRSANKYLGSKVWSFLAKIIVTINLFFSLVFIYDTIRSTFFNDYVISSEIEKFKEQLPLKIDSFTNLIDITKEKHNIFYTYKLSNFVAKNAHNTNRFKKQIQESLCEKGYTLELLKKDYVLNYTYLDKNDKKFINILTKKEDCGKSIYDLDILKDILKNENTTY